MARSRIHVRRWLVVLAALLLLALLFEMNRFFPGTWPGGGGQGAIPLSPNEPAPEQAGLDIGRVRPAQGLPSEWPPRQGVRVRVLESDGHPARSARLGVGAQGPEDLKADREGEARLRDPDFAAEGFRVRGKSGLLHHRGGTGEAVEAFVVYLPENTPSAARQPGDVLLRVTDGSGTALAGVQARAVGAPDDEPPAYTSNKAGEIHIPRAPVRLEFELRSPGHRSERLLLTGQRPGPLEVPLSPTVAVELALAGLDVAHAVRATDGEPLGAQFTRDPTSGRWRGEFTQAELDGSLLLGERARAGGREAFSLALGAAARGADPPAARIVRVRLRDVRGDSAAQVDVTARWGVPHSAPSEGQSDWQQSRSPTNASGEAQLYVPDGVPLVLRIQDARFAPVERSFLAEDATDTVEWVLEPALQLAVEVLGPDGAPLAGAFVLARAALGQGRSEVTGTTDGRGRCELGPLAVGAAEVFAHAPGHAWGRAAVEVAAGMGTLPLRLAAGHDLRLVVEDPHGHPLKGVRVEISSERKGEPWVEPPGGATLETDEQGVLRLSHVPLAPLTLHLLRQGYASERLHKVVAGPVTYFASLVPHTR